MLIKRTANAGVLLTLDGVSVLLDGVSREIAGYLPTPPSIREALCEDFPDLVAFTHPHEDHFDIDFARSYHTQTLRPILGPESLPVEGVRNGPVTVGGVTVTPVGSRHIGKASTTTEHVSFILEGSRCVWFLGDASPAQWRSKTELPRPDVLMVPYAYATTDAAWKMVCDLGAKTVVLLHLPDPGNDPYGLWDAVKTATGQTPAYLPLIPAMGETVTIN